jgi:hypothetical protein
MYETDFCDPDEQWEAGFEGGRSLVVTRLAGYVRAFPLPKGYTKRFFHRVHPLNVHDWHLPMEPRQLGNFCTIAPKVSIRFQATHRYARDHLEWVGELDEYIKSTHEGLIRDRVELEIQRMETDPGWLSSGHGRYEKSIETQINELLAVRHIQCRTLCRIDTEFAPVEAVDAGALLPWSRHQAIYLELLKRQREAAEQARQAQDEQALTEQRLKLELEQRLLSLSAQAQEFKRARREIELERLASELKAEEALVQEQRQSEARQHEEQIKHHAKLQEVEMEAELRRKTRSAKSMDDMETHVRREIELLAMERQRLLLEAEVQEVKVAKAKGWVINAKRRFPLGDKNNIVDARESDAENPPLADRREEL